MAGSTEFFQVRWPVRFSGFRAVALLLKDHGAAQDARVEVPGRATLRTVMNMVTTMPSAGRQVGDVNVRRRFCHALTVPRAGTAHTRRDSARPRARLGPAAVSLVPLSRTDRGGSRLERSASLTPRSRALSQTRVTRVQTSVHRQGSDRRTVPIRCAIVRQYRFGDLSELTFHRLPTAERARLRLETASSTSTTTTKPRRPTCLSRPKTQRAPQRSGRSRSRSPPRRNSRRCARASRPPAGPTRNSSRIIRRACSWR